MALCFLAAGFAGPAGAGAPPDPTIVLAEVPPAGQLKGGLTTILHYRMTNNGATGTFDFTASNSHSYPVSVTPTSATVNAGGQVLIDVSVVVPWDVISGIQVHTTLRAARQSSPSFNTITTSLLTIANNPPICTSVYPSVSEIEYNDPAHMVMVSILGAYDPDGDPVTVTTTGVWADELIRYRGAGLRARARR
jgi:hypothetical protein